MKIIPIVLTSILIYQLSIYPLKKRASFLKRAPLLQQFITKKPYTTTNLFRLNPKSKKTFYAQPSKTPLFSKSLLSSQKFFNSIPLVTRSSGIKKPTLWHTLFNQFKRKIPSLTLFASTSAVLTVLPIHTFVKNHFPELYKKAIRNPKLFPTTIDQSNVEQMLNSDDQTEWLIKHIMMAKNPEQYQRYLTLIRSIPTALSNTKQGRLVKILDTLTRHSIKIENLTAIANIIVDYNLIQHQSSLLPDMLDAILSHGYPSTKLALEQAFFSDLQKTGIAQTTLNPQVIYQFQLRNIPQFRQLFNQDKKKAIEKLMSFPIDIAIKILYVIANPFDAKTTEKYFTIGSKNFDPGYMESLKDIHAVIKKHILEHKPNIESLINNIDDPEVKDQVHKLYRRLTTKKAMMKVFQHYTHDQIFNSFDQLIKKSYYKTFKPNPLISQKNRNF